MTLQILAHTPIIGRMEHKTDLDQLTLTEAAEKSGVSSGSLRRAIRLSHLDAKRFGKTYVITTKDLQRWLKEYHNPKMRRR